ncbi:hypothetical protein HDU98_008480 [Podochytrium sp. JEL0797]|nr:hypothetical protein HDU98_008480 [Podochytrium sp. JEL0797]
MADRLHKEDTDRVLALHGILGVSGPHATAATGREVGGELARVIRHNQTGVRKTRHSLSDDDEEGSEETEEEDEHSNAFKFGVKVGLNDQSPTTPLKKPTTQQRTSYASGLSYPSGSNFSTNAGEESPSTSSDESEIGSSVLYGGNSSSSQIHPSPKLAPSLTNESALRNSMLHASGAAIKSLRSSHRNSAIPRDEPLRPWEMPGMGTIKPQGSVVGVIPGASAGTRSSQPINRSFAGGNGSRPSSLLDHHAHLSPLSNHPLDHRSHSPRTYTPSNDLDVRVKKSVFSLNSSILSSEGSRSGAVTPNGEHFDESQYMRALFGQFSNDQILASWNSYVVYTGQVYTLEQIVALRGIYGINAQSPGSTPAVSPVPEYL